MFGRGAEAEAFLIELQTLSQKRYIPAYFVATTHAGLGNTSEALEWLERAFNDRSHWLLYLKIDPRLASLRGQSPFQDVIRRVGLP